MRTTIIGCGNPDRGDDAAGLLVARRLRELGIDAQEHSGEGLSLIDAWQDATDVILIDAAVTGAEPGTIHDWDGVTANVIAGRHQDSSHAFGVAEGIKMARVLGRMPNRMRVLGIEAQRFDFGAPPSPHVKAAVETLAALIAKDAG